VPNAIGQSLLRPSATHEQEGVWWRSFLRGEIGLIATIAALSIATGFLYFHNSRDFYTSDSMDYVTPAVNMLAGHGFASASGDPETVRTPGYPLLILPFLWTKLDMKYLVIFQHLLRIIIIFATSAFAYRLTGSRTRSLLVGILLCLDLPTLDAANTVLTELPFTAVLLLVLWLLWKESENSAMPWTFSILSGFLTGAATLIRPVGMFFFLPAAAYLLLVRRSFRFRAGLSFILAFACLPLLWAARNYSQTGYFTVSSAAGLNMLFYRAAGTLAVNDPGDFHVNLGKRRDQLQREMCDEFKNLYPDGCIDYRVAQKGRPAQSEYFMRLGRRIVLQHPFAYVKLAARGAGLMMLDGGAGGFTRITGIDPHLGVRLLLIYTLPTFCLAVIGLSRLWSENRQLFYLAFLTISYFVAITAGAEAYSRFRVPIMPVYATVIATGADVIRLSLIHISEPSRPLYISYAVLCLKKK